MSDEFFSLFAEPLATGDEKSLLHTQLKVNRQALLWKVEGLGEAEQRQPMTATGTNLVGLVKHLTLLESSYLCDAFGQDRPPLSWESDEDAVLGELSQMYAKPSETAAKIVAGYEAAAAAADRAITELDLDTTGQHPPTGVTISLRWMLVTVLVDTARHVGHADVLRELTDGAVGWYSAGPAGSMVDDDDYREKYVARVRGEVNDEDWYAFVRAKKGVTTA